MHLKYIYTFSALAVVAALAFAAPSPNIDTRDVDRQINQLLNLNAEIRAIEANIEHINQQIDAIDTDLTPFNDSLAQITDSIIVLNRESTLLLRKARKSRRMLSGYRAMFSKSNMKALSRMSYVNHKIEENTSTLRRLHNDYFTIVRHRDNIISLADREPELWAMLDDANERLDIKSDDALALYTDLCKQPVALSAAMERRRNNDLALNTMVESNAPAASSADNDFANHRGSLIFPVSGSYSIVSQFGKNNSPRMPKVTIENPGIDISVPAGTNARAVYAGKVSAIFQVNGFHNVVMVRHGDYITVYANLAKVTVKKGEKVKAGQTLGTIYTDRRDNNRTVLHFEVRKGSTKLNPLNWVRQ